MNKPIRRVSVFCLLLVMVLMVRANWVQGVDASALDKNANNKRGVIDSYSYPRGDIVVAGGKSVTKDLLVNGNYYKYRRAYIDGPVYAPVTGYSSQTYGNTLLESVENPILNGSDSRLFFRNTLDVITGKQKQGGDVITTIEPAVQQAAYNGLKNIKRGAAVAIDPTTGAVLAEASYPSYDPTSIAGVTSQYTDEYNKLNKDPNQPMLNRAIRNTYQPGSTFKLITAAAALETGKITDINAPTQTDDPWTLPDTNTPLTNEDPGCKNASLMVAIEISCNTVMAKLGYEVGNARMAEEAKKFGFNDPDLEIPVAVDKSNFDVGVNAPQTALSSIGQFDTEATPMEMAMVAAAIANNGKLMKPYLVSQLRSADTSVIQQTQPQVYSQATTPQVAQEIQTMMEKVVQSGTGTPAQIPGVTVGGKTGTAQHGENNDRNPYAWFVSFAKSGDKQVAVAVVVESSNTSREEISGAGLAAPIAKSMMEAALGK